MRGLHDVDEQRSPRSARHRDRAPRSSPRADVRVWEPRKDGALETSDVMQFLRELALTFDVRAVAYDPRLFEVAGQQLLDEGLPMQEVPQSVERMTGIVGAAYEAIRRREITHSGDRTFERHVLAAVTRPNDRGFTISKGKSRDKIDAAIAMVLALHPALMPEAGGSELFIAWG